MKLTHAQRVNNVAASLIQQTRQSCENMRKFLKEGLPLAAGDGCSEGKITAEELQEALGENLKPLQTMIEYVLDGKSNQITKGLKTASNEAVDSKKK